MIGKIILVLFLIGEGFMHYRHWGKDLPHIVGVKTILVDVIEFGIMFSIITYW